ncbi:MAG: EamA family transporter, partial [Planctomycetota bacterium]|nr:EamA family transporter [Planctomycetota bacterium]
MSKTLANLLGTLALIGWSLNIAVTRRLAEVDPYGLPAVSFIAAGIILLAFDHLRSGTKGKAKDPIKFWLLGGGAFVAYIVSYVLALSRVNSSEAGIALGLVNYFWPVLILFLLPFFSHCRVSWTCLAFGMALCLSGVAFALLWGIPAREIVANLEENREAFIIMLAAAFLWAFYSNAIRQWSGNANGTGWFQLASGLVFLVLWWERGTDLGLTPDLYIPLLLHILIVNASSYLLWDLGVRYGDIVWLGILSNFLPLASVLFGVWYLETSPT